MVLIVFGHAARVGKDTAADYLVKNYKFTKVAFADPLKEAIRVTHGYDDRQLYGDLKETIDPFWGETPRQTLQRFGTDALRTYYRQDVWTMAAKRRILDIGSSGGSVVVSDCRFPNEADMTKALGGYVVKILGSFRGRQDISAPNHESEVAMSSYDEWDLIIDNSGTLEDFYKKVDGAFHQIMKKRQL